MSYLIDYIGRILTWIEGFFAYIFQWLWHELLGALVTVLSAIPVPGFMHDAPSVFAGIPGGVAWFLGILQLPAGLAILVAALTIRFLIRRLPIIG